jgi:hypothetical protein
MAAYFQGSSTVESLMEPDSAEAVKASLWEFAVEAAEAVVVAAIAAFDVPVELMRQQVGSKVEYHLCPVTQVPDGRCFFSKSQD